MAYTTPPTFVDDAVLSAAQLNILAQNVEYLYGLAQGANIPFAQTTVGLNYQESVWVIRHRARYLNVSLAWEADPAWVDTINTIVEYNGTEIYNQDLTGLAQSSTLNLDLDPLGLTDGTVYEIVIKARAERPTGTFAGTAGGSYMRVDALWEDD